MIGKCFLYICVWVYAAHVFFLLYILGPLLIFIVCIWIFCVQIKNFSIFFCFFRFLLADKTVNSNEFFFLLSNVLKAVPTIHTSIFAERQRERDNFPSFSKMKIPCFANKFTKWRLQFRCRFPRVVVVGNFSFHILSMCRLENLSWKDNGSSVALCHYLTHTTF